jgi:DNA-binding transcriptional ArsR family regulator
MTDIIFVNTNMICYNNHNMKTDPLPSEMVSRVFSALDTPARIQILLAIGVGEACVCHLEASLGLRQAYISQQLMELREQNLVSSRREGRYIFHRIEKPEVLDLVRLAAQMSGLPAEALTIAEHTDCECPHCANQVADQSSANPPGTCPSTCEE